MKKLLTTGFIVFLNTSIFATTASMNMVAIKDKSLPFPQNSEEIYAYVMNDMACMINIGDGVKVLETTFSQKKVMNLNNGCIGWIPTEFID